MRVSAAGILADGPQSEAKKLREAATAYSNLRTMFFSSSRCCLAVLISLETGTSCMQENCGRPTVVMAVADELDRNSTKKERYLYSFCTNSIRH